MYYNTTHIEGNELKQAHEVAETQSDIILDFFRRNWIMSFTPFDVQDACLPNTPITSIRRAITDLTDDDKLIKLQDYKLGKHGKRNHRWQYLFPEEEDST